MSERKEKKWPVKVPRDYRTRQKAMKELGVTPYRFVLLVENLGGPGEGIINSQGEPITEQDKGKAAYVSPDFFNLLSKAKAELTRAGEDWFNATQLEEFLGCGPGELRRLMDNYPPEVGEYDDDSLSRQRGLKVRHFSLAYAERLQALLGYRPSKDPRTPRERSVENPRFQELSPSKIAEYSTQIEEAMAALDEKIRMSFPGADPEEVRDIKAQAIESKIKFEQLLASLKRGDVALDFEDKLTRLLDDLSYDLEAFNDL